MKSLKFAALVLVLAATSVSAQSMAKDTGKGAMKKPSTMAKKDAMDAHKEAKAAEKTADKAMAMAADAKKDAKAANKESHVAMGGKTATTAKKAHRKAAMAKDTTMGAMKKEMTKKP